MTTTNETSPEYVMDEFDGEMRVYIDDHGNQGTEVGQFYQYETAARFVQAVNAHDDLVARVAELQGALYHAAGSLHGQICPSCDQAYIGYPNETHATNCVWESVA